MIEVIEIDVDKPVLCREVLEDLPDWFGIPDATAAYIEDAAYLPMLAAFADGAFAGFLSIRRHTEFAVEIHVMGVKQNFHRQGVGRALVKSLALSALGDGIAFLTVKTLAASDPDPHYASTRNFYRALGFMPVEIFPALWGADNPCLLMIRPLSPAPG